jgi:beta-glucanase (GH16 family)
MLSLHLPSFRPVRRDLRRLWRVGFALGLVSLTPLAQATGLGPGPGGGTVPANATMTFDDEFGNGTLDPTKWSPFYTYAALINSEKEVYVPSALTFPSGGGLSIVETKLSTSYQGQSYASGALTTYGTFSQTYGYFEVKAQLPKGTGFWPAFWLIQDNQAWPPEIDVMENIGDAQTIFTTYHWLSSGNYLQDAAGATNGTDYSAGYHTYGVSWLPGSIIFYVDGVAVHTVTGSQVSSLPMYLLLDCAVGGSWPGDPTAATPFPSSYNVAWVHAYQYNSVAAVAKTELLVGPTNLSTAAPSPGGPLIVTSSLLVGSTALPNASVTLHLTDFWGDANIPNSTTTVTVGACAGNSKTPFTIHYTVPSGLAPGTYCLSYWVYDSGTGQSASLSLAQRISIAPIVLTGGAPANTALQNVPYSFTWQATGSPAPSFAVTSGALPTGLTLSTVGVLSGTPTQTGAYSGTVTAHNGVSLEVSQPFSITVQAAVSPKTFAQWESGYSVTSAPTATPQGDGVTNLEKYVADIDPSRPMSASDASVLPHVGSDTTTTPGTTYLTMTYRQNAAMTGVTVNVQTSTDLKTWTTMPANQLGIDKILGTDQATGDTTVEVGVAASGPREFIHLNVTSP